MGRRIRRPGGQVSAEVPDRLPGVVAMGGNGQAGRGVGAHAVAVKRLLVVVPHQHLLQRAALHLRPGAGEAGYQVLVAGAGSEQQLLWHHGAVRQRQHGLPALAPQPGPRPVDGENSIPLAACQGVHQGVHIQHQVRQAVNLAAKLPGPQGRRVIFARHFPHMSA